MHAHAHLHVARGGGAAAPPNQGACIHDDRYVFCNLDGYPSEWACVYRAKTPIYDLCNFVVMRTSSTTSPPSAIGPRTADTALLSIYTRWTQLLARNTKDTPVLMRVRRCTSIGRVVACVRVKFILFIVVVLCSRHALRATGGVRHFSVSSGDTEIGVVFPTR